MFLPITLALSATCLQAPENPFTQLRSRFERAYEARDRAACTALWKEAGELVLPLVDADLEGSLALLETSTAPDAARVKLLRERALWGAELASEVTGSPLLADYTAAFVGWSSEEAAAFRAGQLAHRESAKLLAAGKPREALDQAEACALRASLLGDWWGLAMGHAARARALQASARLAEALDAWSQARWIQHGLGLASDELESIRHVADLCFAEKRDARGLVATAQGQELARRLKDDTALGALLDREAQLAERTKDLERAQAARAERERLR